MESFADFMDRHLYHPESGYYGGGHVRFGGEGHFWTYPMILSPVFGWLVAERIRSVLDCWRGEGLLPPEGAINILELGAGDGLLARDILNYLARQSSDSPWGAYLPRIRYVTGELSPSLRDRQRERLASHIRAGQVRIGDMDARSLDWEGPFVGVVLANELLDALPFEHLRIQGPGPWLERLLLKPDPGEDRPAEVWTPLAREQTPAELTEYLSAMAPLVEDLASCDLLPVDLLWPPSLPDVLAGLGELLGGEKNLGAALLVDYGGTTRHILDPRTREPHVRRYGGMEPDGVRDITCDVDFTEIARLAARSGLEVKAFGHQSDLEGPAVDLARGEALDALARGLEENVGLAPGVARLVAPVSIRRFRRAPCFWMMALAPGSVPCPGPGRTRGVVHPGLPEALSTLRPGIDEGRLAQALSSKGLPPEISRHLKPCGDLAADLSDGGLLEHLPAVSRLLGTRGWLSTAGHPNGAPPL